MNLERFTLIVESYGAASERWPSDERLVALEFSLSSPEAKALLDSEIELDERLALFELPENTGSLRQIESRILSQVKPRLQEIQESQKIRGPEAFEERILKWLLPDFDALVSTFWRPTLAACAPLLLGVVIGI
jgi:hypothetical protein